MIPLKSLSSHNKILFIEPLLNHHFGYLSVRQANIRFHANNILVLNNTKSPKSFGCKVINKQNQNSFDKVKNVVYFPT